MDNTKFTKADFDAGMTDVLTDGPSSHVLKSGKVEVFNDLEYQRSYVLEINDQTLRLKESGETLAEAILKTDKEDDKKVLRGALYEIMHVYDELRRVDNEV